MIMISKTKLSAILAVLLTLSLAACGGAQNASGLLSKKELAQIEGMYRTGEEYIAETLALSESDYVSTDGEHGSVEIRLTEGRDIAGHTFTAYYLLAPYSPEVSGLYRVVYQLEVEPDEGTGFDFFDAIYEEALELYGEPRTEPYSDAGMTTRKALWFLGEESMFQISAFANTMQLDYRIVIPGSLYDYY